MNTSKIIPLCAAAATVLFAASQAQALSNSEVANLCRAKMERQAVDTFGDVRLELKRLRRGRTSKARYSAKLGDKAGSATCIVKKGQVTEITWPDTFTPLGHQHSLIRGTAQGRLYINRRVFSQHPTTQGALFQAP